MKSGDIRRGIESRHAVHSTGPRLGRVSKLRHTDPEEKTESGRAGLSTAHRRVILVWSSIVVLATLLMIVGFTKFWLRTRQSIGGGDSDAAKQRTVRIVSRHVSPSEEESLAIVKQALETMEPEKVSDVFHLGGASPEEVSAFVRSSVERDGQILDYRWVGRRDVTDLQMEGVLVLYGGKVIAKRRQRIAFLTPDGEGVWKVDFNAFARTREATWKRLLDGSSDRAVVRVLVARDTYFNGLYHDESQWTCFAMASPESTLLLPDEKQLLRGYCAVDSPQEKAFAWLFAGGVRNCRATLEIRRIDGADERQFEILRVLAEDWVMSARPFDERFD